MKWKVLEVVEKCARPKIENCKVLGFVEAEHHPAAMLKVLKKFKPLDPYKIALRPA